MYSKKTANHLIYPVSILLMGILLAMMALLWLEKSASAAPEGNVISVNTVNDELNTDGDCSLREAIEAANLDNPWDACPAGSGWDIIILPTNTYILSITGANEDSNLTGDLDIVDDVTIIGGLIGNTVIDADIIDRALHIHEFINVHLVRINIRNGRTPNDIASGDGGGIYNDRSSLTLQSCKVVGNLTGDRSGDSNYGGDGGGIYSTGILSITDSTISLNATGKGFNGGNGGGIYSDGTLRISHSTIHDNTPGDGTGYGGQGGGIYSDGELILDYSTISDNTAGDGTADDNSYGGWGGGLYSIGVLSISYSTINGNQAGDSDSTTVNGCGGGGGGIYSNNLAEIDNSTISGNRAGNALDLSDSDCGGHGGGIKNVDVMTLTNSTVAYNQVYAGDGGGIESFAGSPTYLHNTILANNVDFYGQAPDCNGQVISEGYNLVEDYLNGCLVLVQPGGDILGQDPLLQALRHNGGDTFTHALRWSSPAIDKGQCQATNDDQRNVRRPIDQPGISNADDGCDIGAYELMVMVYLPGTFR